MKKFFGRKEENNIIIDGEELNHLAVLRCYIGEEVIAYVSNEYEYLSRIKELSKKRAVLEVVSKSLCGGNPKLRLTLFQGLPKGDKLELITQKLCELGASEIIPFESEFTIAKPNLGKIQRLNKISEEACKQCGRSLPLVVKNPISFKAMLEKLNGYDLVLFANEKDKLAKNQLENKKNIAIIVGSEGGFSDTEVELIKKHGAKCIGLGERILRTETASIALCSIISYMLNI